jgi:hypothetical protein
MAITEIQAGVSNITGVSPSSDRVNDAQKFVSASIPKELMWAYASKTTGVTSNPVTNSSSLIHTDNILGVDRNGFSAEQVGFEQKGFINSSTSLYKATKTYPKWLIIETNEILVFPAPESGEEGSALYVNYGNIGDTSDLRNAVIYRAASTEFAKLGKDSIPALTLISPTIIYTNAVIGDAIAVAQDAITAGPTDATNSTIISYTKPTVAGDGNELTDVDDLDTDNTIDVHADQIEVDQWWSTLAHLIEDEEDTELATAQIQKINAYIQAFQAEVQSASSAMQATTQTAQFATQASIANAQNDVNASIAKMQQSTTAATQKMLQSTNVNIQNAAQNLQASINDYTLYVQGEVGKMPHELSKVDTYLKASQKYYEWSISEIQMYIQNNSKMINRTIAAQQQSAQQQ